MAQLSNPRILRALVVPEDAPLVVVPAEPVVLSTSVSSVTREVAAQVAQAARDPLADVRLQAQRLRTEAEEEAARTRSKAEHDAQAIRSQARETGFAEGRSAAERQVRDETSAILRGLSGTLTAVNTYRDSLRDEHLEHALRLAVSMAERVLRTALTDDPRRLVGMLTEVLAPVQPLTSLVLRVHPGDAVLVEGCRQELARELGLTNLQVIADRTLPPGSLKCSFEGGDVDASLRTQLERVGMVLGQQLAREADAA